MTGERCTAQPRHVLAGKEDSRNMTALKEIDAMAQPFQSLVKSIVMRCINGTNDALDREDRIQTALVANIITYADAYALRCGDEL